jgi:RNA polymerase sigma-32 factor
MHNRSDDTSLGHYRARVAACHALHSEEERDLALAWRQGDSGAGDRLVAANLRHVFSVAQEYRRWGVPFDDLVQQGNIGLLKAAQHFDPGRETSLRVYAGYWIRAEIRDFVVRCYRIVRLGTTRTERRALRAFRTQGASNPEELAACSGMPEARCMLLWPLLVQNDRSLDAPLPSGAAPRDLLQDERPDPERVALNKEAASHDRARVEHALSALTDRERRIVWARLASDEPETLAQLGKRLGVSRERVRQLEQRARQKMLDVLSA